MRDSRRAPRPWVFVNPVAVFISPKSVVGRDILSSQMEKTQKSMWCTSVVARVYIDRGAYGFVFRVHHLRQTLR